MSFTLGDAIKRENNNFDIIRFVASLAVIFGHSFEIFLTGGYREPLKQILVDDYSGSIAVYIFFFLSGIFITSSFVNSRSLRRFLIMRIYRIWPALIICILLTVFVIGPLFTIYTLPNYFADLQTWKYLVKNCIMIRFEPNIPSVFTNNHFTEAINGSLWTLPMEINCYIIVLVIGIAGVFKRRATVIAAIAVLLLLNHFIPSLKDVLFINKPTKFFFAGIICFMYRDRLVIDKRVGLALIVLAWVVYFAYFKWFSMIFYVALIYGMLLIGTAGAIKNIKLPGDYSYGIYIYGFLVQQTIAHLMPQLKAYQSMLLTIPVSIILGGLSWHIIELPAIKKAKTISAKS